VLKFFEGWNWLINVKEEEEEEETYIYFE